jgi:LPS O-antigen subunit length determinant protein (WzzB/FepE family)
VKALTEENNELKRKFTLEKEEYCQNKEEEKANVKKLKDKQIHRLEEEI